MIFRSVLVVDDSNTNIVLLEKLFEKNGYRVFSALSALEGIDEMNSHPPDIIYLDLLMPGVDGLEFVRMVKKNDKWKHIPVVILSAVTDSEVIRQSLELGVTEYITKPLEIERIISLTKEILSN